MLSIVSQLNTVTKFSNRHLNIKFRIKIVSHLAGSASILTHITLDRQLISDKAGGLVYHT